MKGLVELGACVTLEHNGEEGEDVLGSVVVKEGEVVLAQHDSVQHNRNYGGRGDIYEEMLTEVKKHLAAK